jgi:CspA family cold shock protein
MAAKESPRLDDRTQRGRDIQPAVFEVVGTVKWFDPSKGYGFIAPDEDLPDILLHVTCLRRGGFQTAYEGARALCEVVSGPKGLQAVRICSMDDSTAIHPSQLPQRTHIVVVPESDWERAVVKWFNRLRGFGFLTRGPRDADIWRRFAAAASSSLGLPRPCSCDMARDQTVSSRLSSNRIVLRL